MLWMEEEGEKTGERSLNEQKLKEGDDWEKWKWTFGKFRERWISVVSGTDEDVTDDGREGEHWERKFK